MVFPMSFLYEYRKNQCIHLVNAISRRALKKMLIYQDTCRTCMNRQAGNDYLMSVIAKNEPFAAVRFGGTEIRMIADVLYGRSTNTAHISGWARSRVANTGFFPTEFSEIEKYADLCLDKIRHADAIGVWNMFMEDYILRQYAPQIKMFDMISLESFYFANPWTAELAGKKVLVIHPFARTIEEQYQKRTKLFTDQNVLPEFKLETIKAVQTIAGTDSGFKSWFDALEWMYDQAMDKDFDIALIGCGAYGFPLAVKLKQSGKMAVQICGPLQLYFGIKGKRWDKNPIYYKMYNPYWVRPSLEETPQNALKVEHGCYW